MTSAEDMVLGAIPSRVKSLRARYADRDSRMAEVQAVRRGNFEAIAPDLFSDEFRKPIVANMIDTAARDVAAVLAPLPAFNCSASSMLSDRAKNFADKRTKIVNGYIAHSKLEWQMLSGADRYNTYGLMLMCIEPDFDNKRPLVKVEDSIGAYPVWNSFGMTTEVALVTRRDWFSLCADYPQLEQGNYRSRFAHAVGNLDQKVEVVKHVTGKRIVCYLPDMGNCILEDIPNLLGRCPYVAVQRPNLDEEIRGAYDDVIWVQLARHRLQMLLLEGVDKAVRSPLVVPNDVHDVPYGSDAVVRTAQGVNSVGRARLDMPAQAFGAVEQLANEQRLGAMSPEARGGSIDASVVTGRGVQQLMAGFSSQISAAQTVFKYALECVVDICFEMDEKFWPNESKEVRGQDAGVPYSIRYTPERDIDGDHSVDISYGFAAGLDPNRALVFLLQADGAGIISKDYLRRALPVGINAAEEEKKILVEQSRNAIIQAFSALSQSIPQLAATGMDPMPIIQQQARFIALLQKGKSVEEAATEALTPPEPPPGAAEEGGPPGAEGSAPPGGFNDSGLPANMKPGLATKGPNGRPDLNMMFAGLTGGGNPNLQAGVSRYLPTG